MARFGEVVDCLVYQKRLVLAVRFVAERVHHLLSLLQMREAVEELVNLRVLMDFPVTPLQLILDLPLGGLRRLIWLGRRPGSQLHVVIQVVHVSDRVSFSGKVGLAIPQQAVGVHLTLLLELIELLFNLLIIETRLLLMIHFLT